MGAALALRQYGINWDQGIGFHPDERSIYMRSYCMFREIIGDALPQYCSFPIADIGTGVGRYLNPSTSPLNPHWFPLGTILIYVLVIGQFMMPVTDVMDLRLMGRSMTVFADILSIIVYYRLAYKMFGLKTAVISGLLLAFSVSLIQHSLFYRPEPFMVLFSGLVLLNCWNRYSVRTRKPSVWIGIFLGFAIAFKVSSVLLALPIFVLFLSIWKTHNHFLFNKGLVKLVIEGVMIALLGAATFFVTSPFTLLDYQQFYTDIKTQSLMAGTAGLFPFTTQYIGTSSIMYNAKQLFYWGLGIPVGITSVLLIGLGIWSVYKRNKIQFRYTLLCSWVIPFFLFMESYEVRFLRYLFPIIPVIFILNADLILRLAYSVITRTAAILKHRCGAIPSTLGTGLVLFILLGHIVYGIGFVQIYKVDHTAIQASEWIQQHVPTKTKIIMESHWDEQIPGLHYYDRWLYPAYDEDTIDKIYRLAVNLESSEYVMFYSNRPYVGILADQDRYPYSSSYYKALFEGNLGYELNQVFQENPKFAGISIKQDSFRKTGLVSPDMLVVIDESTTGINVGYADENVINYDHPTVLLFKNTSDMAAEAIMNVILDYDGRSLYPYEQPQLSKLRPIQVTIDEVSSGTISDVRAVLIWVVTLILLSILAIPTALVIARFLPDRGYGLSKILGLFLVSYFVWVAVSSRMIEFSASYCFMFIGIFAIFNVVVLYRCYSEITTYFRNHWKYMLIIELVFFASFVGFLILRMNNPDLWHPYRGGEKPMELAYFNAVVNSVSFPPFDPWMSGSKMNYYYWGYVPLSVLTKITYLPTVITFNLGIITLFSITCTLLFSLASNLFIGLKGLTIASLSTGKLAIGALWGLLGIVTVILLGNLDGVFQISEMISKEVPFIKWFGTFDYWRSSRIVPVLPQLANTSGIFWVGNEIFTGQQWSPHITEFPFFTFLFADLHAHLISIPFSIMVLILGINTYLSTDTNLKSLVSVMLFAVGCGSLFAINAWDFPTYCGLGLLLLIARAVVVIDFIGKWQETILLMMLYVIIGYFSFWFFHTEFNSAEASLVPSLWATPVWDYIQIKFLPLSCIVGLTIFCIAKDFRTVRRRSSIRFNYYLAIGFMIGAVIAFYVAALGWMLSGMLVILLMVLAYIFRSLTCEPGRSNNIKWIVLPVLLMSYSVLIDLGVEFVRYDDDIGRMNTLFKFYLQSWVLSGIASVGLLIILSNLVLQQTNLLISSSYSVVFAVVLIVLSTYPVFAIYPRINDRFIDVDPTLDGLGYAEKAIHSEQEQQFSLSSDRDMLKWLIQNVQGTPVILEATGDQYRWNGRVSAYTGFPTVLGWPWHQTQQKPYLHSNIINRSEDIKTLYQTENLDLKLNLIDKYDIELIVFGELESIYYGDDTYKYLQELETLGFLDKIYSNDYNTVYLVRDY